MKRKLIANRFLFSLSYFVCSQSAVCMECAVICGRTKSPVSHRRPKEVSQRRSRRNAQAGPPSGRPAVVLREQPCASAEFLEPLPNHPIIVAASDSGCAYLNGRSLHERHVYSGQDKHANDDYTPVSARGYA